MFRRIGLDGRRLVVFAMFALMLLIPSFAMAQCPYGSVQSRVQVNETVPWMQALSIAAGTSFRVGAFKNNSGQFVDPGTATITVVRPDGTWYQPSNGSYQTASAAGTYTVRVNCGALVDTATVSATGGSTTYSMLDYMMNDQPNKSIILKTRNGDTQVFREYFDPQGGNRFYITKNWNGTGADEYEEYTYDDNSIYLVRDTSWQAENSCSGQPTMMELWTGGRNRAVRFPRYITLGSNAVTWATPAFDVKARLEGNGCSLCNTSPATGTNQIWTWRFRFHASYLLETGVAVPNVIKAELISGPGAGNGEYYLFSKGLGWIGYGETVTGKWSHFSHLAEGGNDFPIVIQPPCSGQGGCIDYQSNAGNVYHQTGSLFGTDWETRTSAHNAGFMAYGPYDRRWGNGPHTANFRLMIDNRTADNAVVATIDVVTASGARVLARRDVRRQEFTGTYAWQNFALSMMSPSFEELETRIYWHDNAYIRHDKTQVCRN